MKIKVLLLFLLASVALHAQENETTPLSLSDAIQLGLKENYQIQIVKLNEDIARNNNKWGVAGALPSVSFDVNSTNQQSNGPNMWTRQIETSQTIYLTPGVSLNWVLFDGYRMQINKQNLEDLERLSEGNSAVVIETAVQSMVLAYYQVIVESQKLDVLTEVYRLSRDQYSAQKERKELGTIGTYELLQAKTAFLSDSASMLMQAMNVKNATMNLNLLLAQPPGKSYQLSDTLPVYLDLYHPDDLFQAMTANNTTLKNQYINQELLKNATGMQRSAMYPVVSMRTGSNANFGRLIFQDFDINAQSTDIYANFTLSFNLYNGGKTRTAIQNAKIQEQIGRIQTNEMVDQMSIRLFNTLDLYTVRQNLYMVAKEAYASNALNLILSEEKFEAGAITSFDFRNVQNQYLDAAFNRLQAQFQLIEAHLEIARLTGGLLSEFQE